MVTMTTTTNIAAADMATATASDADEAKSSPLESSLSGNGDDGNINNHNEMMHPSSPSPLFKNNISSSSNNDAPTNHNDRTTDAAMVVPSAMPANDTIGGGTNGDAATTVPSDTDITDKNIIIHSNSTTSSEQPIASPSLSNSSTRQSVSLPSTNQQQQQQQHQQSIHSQQTLRQHQPLVDESKIQKAISFLHNPAIRDVSNNSKRLYLKEKTDLNMDEIDAAMSRIRRMEFSEGGSSGGGGVDDNVEDGIIDGGGDGITLGNNDRNNDHQQRHPWQGKQQHPGDHYTQRKQQLRQGNPSSHREYDHYNTATQRYPPSQSQPSSPQLQDDNEYNNNWQRARGYYDDPQYQNKSSNYPDDNQPHHREWEGDGGEVNALGRGGGGASSWVGGFSLGILGLAAWRWLNGGDFVLFPPPNIIISGTSTTTVTTPTTTTKSAAAPKKEEEEKTKTVSWKDLPSCPEEVEEQEEDGYEDEDQEEEEEEGVDDEEDEDNDVEYDDEDELAAPHDLHSLLNHKNSNKIPHNRYHSHSTNSSFQHHQPQMQHPSYNELVLEIRALTSAIHSHRDSQERIARNAYNTNVGKGMTDDAMDFLRKKKEENSSMVDVSKQENLSTVALLLKEVSGDLLEMKQSMNLEPREDGNEGSIVKAGTAEENSKNEEYEEELKVEGTTNRIDMVIEKVQKMLTLVDEKPIKIEGGNNSASEDGTINCDKDAVMKEGEDEVMNATTIISLLEAPTESVPSEEGADAVEAQELKAHHEDDVDLLPTTETLQLNSIVPNQHEEQPQKQQHQQKLLEDALRTLATSNDAQKLKVGAQMLYLYCRNISQNSSVPRYRKIYTNNNTYRNKVGNLVGARDFLIAVGFIERAKENLFEWSDPVGGGDTEALIKSKLDFAMVALELMKNGAGVDANGGDCKDAKKLLPVIAKQFH